MFFNGAKNAKPVPLYWWVYVIWFKYGNRWENQKSSSAKIWYKRYGPCGIGVIRQDGKIYLIQELRSVTAFYFKPS